MKRADKLKSAALFLGASAAALIGTVAGAAAQDTDADVIIVTAQKREQNIQDVPIAMSAISGEGLQTANIASVNELQQITPSLFVNTTNGGAADTTIRIRGVGTTGNNPGLEGAVGVFIDGVYRNRAGMALGALDDISRVEVLRGPQSTLFGRNTSAGALSVITNAPTQDLEGYLQGTIGDWSRKDFNGWINLPVSDTFATRFSGGMQSRDGFLENRVDGADMNGMENWYLRGQALWDISPDASLRLIADYNSADTACCGAVRVTSTGAAGTTFFAYVRALEAAAGIPVQDRTQLGSYSETTLNQIPENEAQDWGVSGELNWDLSPNVTLTNILAYRDFGSERSFDADYSGADILNFDTFDDDYTTVTEELRLSGNIDGALGMSSIDWMAGVFYSQEDVSSTQRLEFGADTANYVCGYLRVLGGASPFTCPTPVGNPYTVGLYDPADVVAGQGSTSVFDSQAESWSIFAQSTFNFTERFRATLGLRYIDDHKEATGVTSDYNEAVLDEDGAGPDVANELPPLIGLVNDIDATVDDTAVTGTINVQYDWTPDFMTYASVSRGYKAGGINLDRAAATTLPPFGSTTPTLTDPTFDPEFSDNYEIGLKSQFDDGRLGVNFTVFNTNYEDLQILAFTGLQFFVQNASGGYSRGAELETTWQPTENFTLTGGVTYAYTRYDDGIVIGTGGTAINSGGLHFTNAPVWSGAVGATYSWNILEDLEARIHGDFFYGSGRNTGTQQTPQKYQNGYGLLNLRASLLGHDGDWDLSLWCRNCTDREYYTVIFDAPFQGGLALSQGGNTAGFVGAPREVGLSLAMHF